MQTATADSDRLYWIDVFRGLAILLMIPANLAPYYAMPHEMWYRIFGSYAAPMFVSISAGMVMLRGDRHPAKYYVERGLLVLLVGVLLDAALWLIMPGTSFDVLYIIGPGMILAWLARNWNSWRTLAAVAFFFAMSVVLRNNVGYNETAYQIYWNDFAWPAFPRLMQSWFIDGWFAIFPWMGFSLFGVWLFRMLFRSAETKPSPAVLLFGAACAVIGFSLLWMPVQGLDNFASNAIIESREAYSEIFYPPTMSYLLSAVGVVILFALGVRMLKPHKVWSALAYFGRYSMLVYILHQALGYRVVSPLIALLWDTDTLAFGWSFALLNVLVAAVIALLIWVVERVKLRYRPRMIFLQIIFGR